ncbi:NUDIX hydrolase domain-like protein [Aspergillus parasiticus]|uniref:isopentenyl-diphosphate Delta-isomerase n=1 Tax=Aspergillus parasiticus TaxID=5067 RepID=A0A5N6DTP9_ASPPA|nr:NUDIX hydrolase domain-like protein [Aspergillus parasiticus]
MCHAKTGSSAITAENVHELFPEVEALSVVSPTTCGVSAAESGDFEGYDEEQVRMMDEVCIVLDVDDEPIGRASKECSSNYLLCHPMTNIDKGLLHRAFACFELGIKPEQVPLEDFHFLTRVHYKAPSDGKWGEHEMDYILFIQADVDLAVNRNEVQDFRWVSPEDLKRMFSTPGLQYTPWFKLICESLLFKYTNETIIRRM